MYRATAVWFFLAGLTGYAVSSGLYRSEGRAEMLGRWDGKAREGDVYPLWFELSESGGALRGRFQPRFGHALAMDRVEASGNRLTFVVAGERYEGELVEGRWKGTGQRDDGARLEWTAVRAPALPAPPHPRWGEPVSLFDGKDLTGWTARHPSQPNLWRAREGVLVNEGAGSDLLTEELFQDFNLHIEVNVPPGGNSGIYLRGRYEVQVQDDYGKEPHSRQMGGVYGQITPTANAARPAGEWQVFVITLLGRWLTVSLNGKTIIDRQEIPGITGGALDSREEAPGPLMIQGDHGPVSYRNVLLTPVLGGER